MYPNFILFRDFIVILVTCKNKEDPVKYEGARVFTTFYITFQTPRADNSGVGGDIWLKFELIKVLIYVLITCENENDSIKNEGARVVTTFFHYKYMGIFQDAQGQLTQQSLVRSGRISNSFEMLWLSSIL